MPTPPADPVLAAVERLREPGILLGGLREAWAAERDDPCPFESAELGRIHYRPFARARLVVRVRLTDAAPVDSRAHQFYSFQVYPDLARARRQFGYYLRRPALGCVGPPVTIVPAWRAVAFALPNGPRLRNLAKFFDRERTRSWLEKKGQPALAARFRPEFLDLVRYVPRKRALLRLHPSQPGAGDAAWIKLYTREDYGRAARNLGAVGRAARAKAFLFRSPERLARGHKKRAVVMAEVPGRTLTEAFGSGAEALLGRVGAALASLHRAEIRVQAAWSPRQELDAVATALLDIVQALPRLEDPARRLLDRLACTVEAAARFDAVPVHANLFGDQILAGEAGLGIVDWDDLALGDAAFDLGRLIAHHRYETWDRDPRSAARERVALVEGHAAHYGSALPPARLAWHVASSLALRAKISALRQLAPGWPELCARSLREAATALDRPEAAARGIFEG